MPVAPERSRVLQVLIKFGAGNLINARFYAAGVAVEEGVDAAVPFEASKTVVFRKAPMNLEDPCLGARGDAPTAVLKLRDAEPVRTVFLFAGRSAALFAAMPHSDVPAVLEVYVIHHPAEDLPVGGRVPDPVHKDIVVNHLVNDDILPFGLRKVKGGAYPHAVVRNFRSAEDAPPDLECDFPEERACARKPEWNGRQNSLKAEGIELIVGSLYEGKVRNHLAYSISLRVLPP